MGVFNLTQLLNEALQIIFNVDGGLNYRGVYDSETAYVLGDVASYEGSSYVAIQSSTGNLPTNETYWYLLVSKGDTGETGAQGPQGEAGAGGVWGEITGTLSNQTDLQSALDGKQYNHSVTVGTADADYITDGTDDNIQLQAAIDELETAGGGTLIIKEGTYTFATGLVVTPMNLTSQLAIYAYGAILDYTGTGDALLINTNIDTGDVQKGERTVHTFGLHIKGTSSATCGIRNYGATRCSFKDTTLENFTSVTSGEAALILDARFNYWIEENHYDGLEILNSGNGIAFISRNDVDSVAASCMNNTFTALSIWITQDNGKGIYGVGEGTSGLVQIARCVFNSIIIHPKDVNDVIAFDLTECFCAGTVFNAAGVDTSGTNTGITAFKYENAEILLLNGFTAYPTADIDNWLTGAGQYLVLAGNTGSTFRIDASGNIVAPTLTLLYDIYDANGNSWIGQSATTNAVNSIEMGNATTGNAPFITAKGSDTNIDFNLYGKGSGKINAYSTINAFGGLDVTGNIAVSGTVDGVDVAALETTVETKVTGVNTAKITVSSTEPSSPTTGDIWIDTS